MSQETFDIVLSLLDRLDRDEQFDLINELTERLRIDDNAEVPAPPPENDRIVVRITEGAYQWSYLSLGRRKHFFPQEAVGAPNRNQGIGRELTLHIEGFAAPIQTDITRDKFGFRNRFWREFFDKHHLQPGDRVIIEKIDPFTYRIAPAEGRV